MPTTSVRMPQAEVRDLDPRSEGRNDSGTFIALDMVGIGDFFGPLVVAGIIATRDSLEKLRASALCAPARWIPRATFRGMAEVRMLVPRSCLTSITISPSRYNELIHTMGRQKLIAWAHSWCIENLVGRGPAPTRAVASDFGDRRYLAGRLRTRQLGLELTGIIGDDAEIAVTAASFLAHAVLIRQRRRMRARYGIDFPAGAREVEGAGQSLIALYGPDVLVEVAKSDFRTMGELFPESLRLRPFEKGEARFS